MSLGEHAILRISANCGYGAQGSPPAIPPNSDLVFDVELNGLNGRRAGAGAGFAPVSLPASFAPAAFAPVTLPASFAPATSVVSASSSLPRCIKSSCGHAISHDTSGMSKPLCLCNPMCAQLAGTPGVLPCCPGLQEICLDPYRESKPGSAPPAAAPARMPAVSAPAPVATTLPATTFQATAGVSFQATAAMPVSNSLPTCRTNSCGKAMATAANPRAAACSCDATCMAPGASLPCCMGFAEVCQGASAAPVATISGNSMGSSCNSGKMTWAEQPVCDKKRWAVKGGKCKKVCPAIDFGMGVAYYPLGPQGKAACQAALAACGGW